MLLPEHVFRAMYPLRAIKQLHELLHIQHGHLWLNYLLCGIRLIYWFNPFVHFAFQQLRLDREIYCDYLVIATQGQENALAYGHTLLNFALLMNSSSFPTASNLAGAKQQLKKTHPVYRCLCAADDDWYISQEQLTIQTEDVSSYFNGKDGCFVLYNQNLDQFFIYNEQISRTRVAPNSTYKIFAALDALEQQQITPLNHRQTWDGQRYALSAWNQDQDLNSTMRYSVNWYAPIFPAVRQHKSVWIFCIIMEFIHRHRKMNWVMADSIAGHMAAS